MVLFYHIRLMQEYVSEHETLQAAMRSAAYGDDDQELTACWIVDTDGTEYDNDAIFAWNTAYEEAHRSDKQPDMEPAQYREFKGKQWQVA